MSKLLPVSKIILAVVLFIIAYSLFNIGLSNIQSGSSYNLSEKYKTHGMTAYKDKTPDLFLDSVTSTIVGSFMIAVISVLVLWDGLRKLMRDDEHIADRTNGNIKPN